jgi:hypothetical protein
MYMKIKINQTELKEILDKHFGSVDTHYDIEAEEGDYVLTKKSIKVLGDELEAIL